MTAHDELAALLYKARWVDGIKDGALVSDAGLAEKILKDGYRKVFDGDCGLSNIKDPTEREAAEAWMRWANIVSGNDGNGISAMKQMLTEFGYRKPRTITTREELDALPSGSVILDSEGEPNVFHDNGWVLPGGSGGYTSWSVAQSLPATVLYEPEEDS